jgi:hypothetical protein
MVAAYFSPIWWVSLTAPNYPKDAFPDGIRIHFHFDGVYNGCKAAGKGTRMANETMQKDIDHDDERYNPITDAKKDVNKGAEGLDCVHEMNTINHYVGMFPIATGAPVEKPLAKFFFGFFAVMLLASCHARKSKRALAVLAAGFAAVAAWMVVDQFVLGHLESHVSRLHAGGGHLLQGARQDQGLGRQRARASPCAVIAGLIVAMAIVVAGVAKLRGFSLLLALVPALLPVFFVIDLRRLALVLRPQHASLGRLHGQALHAHRIRRRQGGAVLDLFLSLLGLRAAAGASACLQWRCCCAASRCAKATG